jgi:AraC family transcriptional regulator of adaptative response / DNA-3-methyladenine glycosylase II
MPSPDDRLDDAAAYEALRTRDARFDGRFFVGVTSTGIYCRPVCRVRLPRASNCRFFPHAAAAQAAGFRPCLRCRPEQAPGLSRTDSSRTLAHVAAQRLERAVREGLSTDLTELAASLGVTDRHLRRLFQEVWSVTPMAYLTTHRLLLGKQLLTDTAMPVAEVALACGFDSVRRFQAALKDRCRLSPTDLRRQGRTRSGTHGPDVEAPGFLLSWRPPIDLPGLWHFFARRALPGIESVEPTRWRLRRTWPATRPGEGAADRTATLAGWVELQAEPARCRLRLTLSPSLLPRAGQVLASVRQALDLDADPAATAEVLAALERRQGWPAVEGLRLPGSFDAFESAVRIVLGQQVSVAAARTLAQRVVEAADRRVDTPWPELSHLFPDAATLAAWPLSRWTSLGIVKQRAAALQALSAAVRDGLPLHPGADLTAVQAALSALPGIGPWTVQLISLRIHGWPDAFPGTDLGLLQALGTRDTKRVQADAQSWRPWRAYGVIRAWQALDPPPPALAP